MNNIEKHLRQLHQIEANSDYVRDSRTRLMMLVRPQPARATFWSFAFGNLRSGPAMAALGLLLFFALGSSVWNLVIGPVARWDLSAEAQAINSQIRLVDLQYKDPGYERPRLISPNPDFSSITIASDPEEEPALPATTPPDATASSTEPSNSTSTPATLPAEPAASSTPATATSTPLGVEQVLDILSR